MSSGGFGGIAKRGMCWAGPPMDVIVAAVGSMRADMVASIPLGWRSSGEARRPAERQKSWPDGQQQLVGRYTLAWNGGGLIVEGNRISDSVLNSVWSTAQPFRFKVGEPGVMSENNKKASGRISSPPDKLLGESKFVVGMKRNGARLNWDF